MTALKEAFVKAERAQSRFNAHGRNPDREAVIREVHRLTDAGVSAKAIAGIIGMSDRNVQRLRGKTLERKPEPIPQPDLSDRHAAALEETVDVVIDLAAHLRDHHPQLVWDTLTNLRRRDLQELAVICLAGLPLHATKTELFGWVLELPAAKWGDR